ncbi:MAG: SPOR domain-containing protein [Terracidiphilus sp.]
MRQYFDDEEEEPEAAKPRRDREVTLGAGAVLGLFFALAIVCVLCFGWGYSVGHRSPAMPPTKTASLTPAPDQEPLQGSDTIPKPSAAETPAAPQTDASSATPAAATPAAVDSANASSPSQVASGLAPGASAGINTAEVQPALPGTGSPAQAAQPVAASNLHSALPNQLQLMVQIAAVRNTDDANVLEAALRKRGYAVTAARDPADGLIHVRVGPFSSQDEAIRWRDKLLGDGYNAQVQQ